MLFQGVAVSSSRSIVDPKVPIRFSSLAIGSGSDPDMILMPRAAASSNCVTGQIAGRPPLSPRCRPGNVSRFNISDTSRPRAPVHLPAPQGTIAWAPAARAASSISYSGLPLVRLVLCPIASTSSFSDDTNCWPLMTMTLPSPIIKLADSIVVEMALPDRPSGSCSASDASSSQPNVSDPTGSQRKQTILEPG